MFQFILIVCLIVNVALADPDRSGQELKHDRNIVNCAKYKREANQHSCVLAPYTMEGPFFLGDDMERSDITDGQKGVPLTFNLKITDSRDCSPLPGLYVHVWSANATGEYSGVNNYGGGPGGAGGPGGSRGPQGFGRLDPNESIPGMGGMGGRGQGQGGPGGEHKMGRPAAINDDRSLRGYQISDENGAVSFQTIVPGWYTGRCQHIHIEVYHDVQVQNVTFVGQVFFPEDLITKIKKISPYTENTNPIVPHAEDDLYVNKHGELMELTLVNKDNGYEAEIILGINPEYEISTDGIQVTKDLP